MGLSPDIAPPEAWWVAHTEHCGCSPWGSEESDTTTQRNSNNDSIAGLQSLSELSNISEVKGALSSGETEVSFLANQLVQAQAKRPRMVKNLPAMQETQVRSLGQEDPLEEGILYSCLGNPTDREA